MNMRICKRLFLIGMALSLVLAGCGDPGTPKSTEAAITALTLTIGGVGYPITFTGGTDNVELPVGASIPDTVTVKSVTLSAGASGLKSGGTVKVDTTNAVANITITAENGTTTKKYTVTFTIGAKKDLDTVDLSYTEVKTTAGTANDTGVAPTWGTPTPEGVTYDIAATTTGENAPGADGSGSVVAIGTDGKITITDAAEAENSGTYTVTATAGSSSNYVEGTQKTATVTVTIAKRSFSSVALSYSETTIRAVQGYANDVGIAPWGAVNPTPTGITYSITDYNGAGSKDSAVQIDPDTGLITITADAKAANSGEYTVTATASADSNYLNDSPLTAPITVEITDTKASLADTSFTYTEVKAAAGTANDIGVEPDWTGFTPPKGVVYEISGGSGAGTTVKINPDNGKITITDAATADHSDTYTVTVTAAGANSNYEDNTTQTTTVTVIIKLDLSKVVLSYTAVTATEGTANTNGVTPAWVGNPDTTGITYSITDYTATAGSGTDGRENTVKIASDTGKITITDAAEAANSGTYTVTATPGPNSSYADTTTQTAEVAVTIAKRDLSTAQQHFHIPRQ